VSAEAAATREGNRERERQRKEKRFSGYFIVVATPAVITSPTESVKRGKRVTERGKERQKRKRKERERRAERERESE